ncbi:MAG TPA: hypothetical protein VFX69_15630 [Steroidobacteraceae bacterium]|jgi:hypothetical protein|nr:hypothetical protein [Steroidobacteraceae bacterium]
MSPRPHPEPRTYVVRVYRRTATAMAGHVEDVETGRARVFATPAELWAAVQGPPAALVEPRSPTIDAREPTEESS